jgi:hypothetical protein
VFIFSGFQRLLVFSLDSLLLFAALSNQFLFHQSTKCVCIYSLATTFRRGVVAIDLLLLTRRLRRKNQWNFLERFLCVQQLAVVRRNVHFHLLLHRPIVVAIDFFASATGRHLFFLPSNKLMAEIKVHAGHFPVALPRAQCGRSCVPISNLHPFQRIELRLRGEKKGPPPPPLVDDEPDQGHDLLLLFWSKKSASSHLVEKWPLSAS